MAMGWRFRNRHPFAFPQSTLFALHSPLQTLYNGHMTDEQTTLPPARLGKALARGFRASYDNLGYVVGASFANFLVCAVLLTIGGFTARQIHSPLGILVLVPAMLAAWIAQVGMLRFARKVLYEGHATISDTWEGIGRWIGPAIALFFADLVITAVLVGDAAFFLMAFKARGGAGLAALGVLFGYGSLIWLMMAVYHLPMLVAQLEMDSGPGVKVVLRKSLLLAMGNPGFTLGFFVVIIGFTALCALPAMLGMAILFPGAAAFLLTSALRELFIKYGVVEAEPDVIEDKPWRLDGK